MNDADKILTQICDELNLEISEHESYISIYSKILKAVTEMKEI